VPPPGWGCRRWRCIPDDDRASLHVRHADETRQLPGRGVKAYLDIEAMIAAARRPAATRCTPATAFSARTPQFARRCAEAGWCFVGPNLPEALELFGDKVQAKALARELGVPVIAGTAGATTLEQAQAFLKAGPGGAVMIKAVAGGGGRGMRAVRSLAELDEAYRPLPVRGDGGVRQRSRSMSSG
jgi:biotin carboxylase